MNTMFKKIWFSSRAHEKQLEESWRDKKYCVKIQLNLNEFASDGLKIQKSWGIRK